MPRKSNEEVYEEAERELYTEAIRQTDQEIFDDVLNRDPDDNDGDNELEQMDDDDAPTGDEDPTEGEEGDKPDEPQEGEGDEGEEGEGDEPQPESQDRGQERRVPPSRLREEAAARRAAEAETRELRARLENLERNQRQAPPQQQPERPARPDIFADPEGWERQTRAEIENSISTRYVNASLADARDEHGEKFDQAFQALTALDPRDPAAQATVVQIYNSPNPGKAVMRWHQRQQTVREVGDDPAAYRNKVAQELMSDPEFRREFLESMRGNAMNGDRGQPRTRVRLPASLNGASGGEGHRSRDPRPGRYTTSAADERDIAASAWE